MFYFEFEESVRVDSEGRFGVTAEDGSSLTDRVGPRELCTGTRSFYGPEHTGPKSRSGELESGGGPNSEKERTVEETTTGVVTRNIKDR